MERSSQRDKNCETFAKLLKEWFIPALEEAEMKIEELGLTWLEKENRTNGNFPGGARLWAIPRRIFSGRKEEIPNHRDHHFIDISFNPETSLVTATHKHPGQFMGLDDRRSPSIELDEISADPRTFRREQCFRFAEKFIGMCG
jgi:hypothetical protein